MRSSRHGHDYLTRQRRGGKPAAAKELGLCPFLPPTFPKCCIGEVETSLISEHGSAPLRGRKLPVKPAPAPAMEQSSASLPSSGTTRLGFATPKPPSCRDTGPQRRHRVAGCPGKRRANYWHHQHQNRPWSRAFPHPSSYPTAPAEARSGWFENK